MKTKKIDKLNPNDKLFLIYYLDHAISREPLTEIQKKPFILWCCGKILNEKDNDLNFFVISSGRLFRDHFPLEYNIIFKAAILEKIMIYQVPEDILTKYSQKSKNN